MAILDILQFPDPRLRKVAEKVITIDADLKAEVADMYETMYHSKGVGLAATQVNIQKQVFVMDISEHHNQPYCILNPEITYQEGIQYESEGCLSVEGAYDKVERAAIVHLSGIDLAGQPIELKTTGLMAICVQHEVDHLNGVLFIDHLSRLKQQRIREKIKKSKR